MTTLELEDIEASLTTRQIGRCPDWPNELWDSIESTNDRALELYREGAGHGVIVLARQQTAGRGRQGRTWISPPGSGLYMSFLLKALSDPRQIPLYTLGAGVAAVRAIAGSAGVELGLKWVNDLVHNGKKVGGILAEMPSPVNTRTGESFIVVGMGINIAFNPEEIPGDLAVRMDWLERIAGPVDLNLMVSVIAHEMEFISCQLESGHTDSVLSLWRKHSITLGRDIVATTGSATYRGQAVDIADSGALILQTREGKQIQLSAGEITIRQSDGSYA